MFSVKIRVQALGGIAALGLLAMMAVDYVASRQIAERRAQSDALATLQSDTQDIAIESLNARRFEKDFMLRRDGRSIELHAQAIGKLGGYLIALESKVAGMDASISAFVADNALGRLAGEYAAAFQTLVSVQTSMGPDRGRRRARGNCAAMCINSSAASRISTRMRFLRPC